MHLLSAILTQATGQSALDFARVNLFEPLGISEADWPADASGISHGWGALALQPRDAARIGQLFLAGGRWADAQVVSSDWVRAATSAHAATGGFKAEDYGYGWWVGRPGLEPMPFFRADGNGGQRILVVPELELVVVATGGGYSFEEVTELVIASATDDWRPLAADPAGVAALREAVEVLSVPPPGERVAALPSIAATLSGRTIRFEDNGFAIRTLRVDWSDGMAEAIVVLDAMNESPVREMLVGLDGLWRMSRAGRPIAARGGWLDERTFSIEVDEGPGIARYTLRIVVEADRVLLEVRGVTVVGHVVR
jgi:hypothetical protein